MFLDAIDQAKMIFPGARTRGLAESRVTPLASETLLHLKTAGGESVAALHTPAMGADGKVLLDAADRPTLLFFYGNGMCLAGTVELSRIFAALGANVLTAEYVGYGMSSGRPSEEGCYETAAACMEWIAAHPEKVARGKVIACGLSLGGAVAVEVAATHKVCGLVLLEAFSSLVDLAVKLYPFLPVRMLLQHRFESVKKIGRVKVPTLIAHGVLDQLVPYGMSEALAAAAGGAVIRVRVEEAGHEDLLDVGMGEVSAALREFIARVNKEGNAATDGADVRR